jgi:hypothetical protein
MNVGLQIRRLPTKAKKADVAEHRKMFRHVGLLFNEPPGGGRVVLHLVIRPLLYLKCTSRTRELQGFHKPFQKPLSTPGFLNSWSQEKKPAENNALAFGGEG